VENSIPIIEAPGLWNTVKAAVRGERKDYTSGSIRRALFMLAVPMVLEMVMESLFAVVDVFYVSRVGVNAVATVGLTESVMMLLYAVGIGLAMSVAAFVARRTGEKNLEAASVCAAQGVFLAFFISIPVSLAGLFFAPQILHLMGGSDELVREGANYTRILLGGNLVIMLLFVNNAVFRGAGDAAIAMRVLWLANALNMLLGPLFIFGIGPFPRLGVTGAAVATTIGRGIGAAYQLRNLSNGRSLIRIHRRDLHLQTHLVMEMLRISVGGMSQFLIGSASWIFMVRILSTFGSGAVAGYTVAMRTIMFTILPSWGLANAAATLVGQNLGAKQPERAEKSVWTAAVYNMFFLGAISVFFITFATEILHIYSRDPEVVRHGTQCLRIICLGYIFYAYGMVLGQAFNGAGDTRTPTMINMFCFWVMQIPIAFVLAKVLNFGSSGVFIAQASSFSLLAIISIVIFRRGHWKRVKL
jgi:putative MATE family efflux protein